MEKTDNEFQEYEETDYYEDIFSTKPKSYMPLVGYDKILSDLIYFVSSGSMVFIEGEEGMGKTSLLLKLIKEFRGLKRVIYLDCQKLKQRVNIEKLLTARYGLMGRVFKILPSNMIVLLDNIGYLSKKNSERIKYFFDQNHIKSVVFTSDSWNQVQIPESLRHRIGKRRIELPRLNNNTGAKILFSRIEENDLMDNVTVNKLYSLSHYNPKEFLVNCMNVFKTAESSGKKKIFVPNLREILDE